eukprot:g5698.t1
MSARSVALVSGCIYVSIYALLLQSVPRKSGLGFVSRLRVHYATTDWSFWMEWTQAVFSIATVVLFVADGYYWKSSYVELSMKLEAFFAVFFSFNFLFELLLSKNRWAFVMSILGIVDLVTIVPVFVALSVDPVVKYPTGFVRLYRVLMLARVLSDGRTNEWGEVSDSSMLTFHDSLYFIIVTFSTVGYGDISPPDTQSRLAIVLLVGFFFFMIPRELNKLNHLLDLSSKYTGVYPKKLAGGHTIVGCDVASCALVASFLEEFFHEDHGYNIMHLVLLVPSEPTMEWKRLVLKFATNDRVTYLKGDLRNTTDLTRASAHTASSCFILTNRHGNLWEEEKRGFMRAITVQDFNPTMRIFVQAPTQEMRQRLVKVSASIDEQQDMPSWVKEYACGLGKEIYVVSIGAFAGRGFSDLVRELFELHGVILLGISEDRRVVLHPGAGYIITEADLGFLVADDADVAESIVEQAVGALLPPFSQTTPASPSLGPKKGVAGGGSKLLSGTFSTEEGAQAGMKSTGRTAMGATLGADTRTSAAWGGAASGVRGRDHRGGGDGGGTTPPSRSFPEDPVKPEKAAAAMTRENSPEPRGDGTGRVFGGVGGRTPSLLALDPLSPSSPRRGHKHHDEVTPGGLRQGSGAERRGSNREGAGVGRVQPRSGATGNRGGDGGAEDEEYVVLLTPTLEQVSLLVAALEAPQVPKMGFVVVCPLYDWNQERDEDEIRTLREFSQVRLVVGPASRASLREAGASRARMVVVRAGKSFPEQEPSDADAEHIGQLVEVTAVAGPNVRAIVELNDMTYGNHYEILVDLLHSSQSPAPPLPHPSPVGRVGDRGSTDTAAVADDELRPSKPQRNSGQFSPGSTWESGNFTLSSTALACFRRGGTGRSRRRWWRRLLGSGEDGADGAPGGDSNGRRGTRASACGSTPVGGGAVSSPAGAAATEDAASAGRAKEGQRARAHWTLTKGVASGAIVPSSLPETLLCQAFYNPAIIMIVEALLDPKGHGHGKDRRCSSSRGRVRDREKRPARDPEEEHDDHFNADDRDRDAKKEGGVKGGRGGGETREEHEGEEEEEGRQGQERGRGEASFLAQILPPKHFFTQAMLTGHRPNFQALMRFMLEEYDALPFGLLRHGKAESSSRTAEESPKFVHCCPDPGQKVMPLDKVFLLAPNLSSWERMQLESPSPTCRIGSADFPRGGKLSQRGFPPEPPGAATDIRGFPILDGGSMNHRNDSVPRTAASSPSPQARGGTGGGDSGGAHWGMSHHHHPNSSQASAPPPSISALPREHRNLFPSPFSSTLPPETACLSTANKFDVNRSSWVGRLGRGKGGGELTGPEPTPPVSPSRQAKGSHAKLDLLLHEMQRLNGRLDTIVGRLGVLEEESSKHGAEQEDESRSAGKSKSKDRNSQQPTPTKQTETEVERSRLPGLALPTRSGPRSKKAQMPTETSEMGQGRGDEILEMNKKTNDAREKAKAKAVDAEKAHEEAERARQEAEKAANEAEKSAIEAETAREEVEALREEVRRAKNGVDVRRDALKEAITREEQLKQLDKANVAKM